VRVLSVLLVIALTALPTAVGAQPEPNSPPPPPVAAPVSGCVPGLQVACACAAGGSRVQVYEASGQKFGPCQCAPAAPATGGLRIHSTFPAKV
jgi:hypothetical protein